MNKVYVVWFNCYEDSQIVKIFSTKEKAENYMKENRYNDNDEYNIQEHDLE